ncbi:uncharacterized protein B0T15DRAFT_93739 [Chaetomium strumarium]|uniref:Uncharacterized protein n=1 Tax=Chaetomium strumarium TaxID=1170767 RepID=A0AAJ0GXK7_9PEZI|nr:hypothetical protein B0T15DRAFT_93739 [Chaetomium strumarium]
MPSLKSAYTITEPHPTVPQNTYTHSGRGGLGNFFRAPATTPSSGVPTPATSSTTSSNSSSSTRRFYSGRGGAGNAHAAVERPVLSFDEEFQRAEVREKTATISHVGRGGAGNIFSAFSPSSSKGGSGDDGESLARHESGSSDSSTRSVADRLWGRITSVGHH